MNYGQFLNMVPEFYLVCILLVVFFMDFFFARRSDKNHEVFGGVTIGLMLVLPVRIALLLSVSLHVWQVLVCSPCGQAMSSTMPLDQFSKTLLNKGDKDYGI